MNDKYISTYTQISSFVTRRLWGSGIAFPDRIALGKDACDRHNAILPESLGRQLFPLKYLNENLKICSILKSAKVVLKCAGCLFCEPKTT